MIKSVIIDDQPSSSTALGILLSQYCTDIEVLGVAHSLQTAYHLIEDKAPDLIFLDIYMPPTSGFDLLKQFEKINFEIIFTTAFEQYAINAIKYSAVDYILKPVDPEHLQDALARYRRKNLNKTGAHTNDGRMLLPVDTGFMLLSTNNLIRIEIKDKDITYVLKNRKPLIVHGHLGDLENKFEQYGFFRCHRGHIINIGEVVEYVADKNGGCVVMSDSRLVPIAARRKEDFLKHFSFLNK